MGQGAHQLLLGADGGHERREPLQRLVAAGAKLGGRAARLGGFRVQQVPLHAAQHGAALDVQLAQPALAHGLLRGRQAAALAQLVQVQPGPRPACQPAGKRA